MKTNRFTRRDFIRTSTVVAAPFILPSHIWSAAVKPNDRIGVGCIGVGTQGVSLMDGFVSKKETQVLAVCDVDTTRRETRRKRVEELYAKQTGRDYKGCDGYKDFRELLARKDIDAVVIATPDHWHAFIAIAACNAAKDIYCEKPLTESIHEARALVDAVRKNKRVFQTGSMQRSSKEFRVACALVRNGVVGNIKNVEVAVGGPGVPCDLPEEEMEAGLDWDMWLGPAPSRSYHSELSPRGVHKHFPNWRRYREYGGGAVTDWGAHHFDIAQWGLGMDESGPVEVIAVDNPKATQGVRLKYANGVEVIHKAGGFGVSFFGEKGKVLVNRGRFELWLGDEKQADPAAAGDAAKSNGAMQSAALAEKQYLADARVKLYESGDHKTDWINAIKSRQKPICDVETGARSVTVCHLVNLAYYHGQNFKWGGNDQFAGGTANKQSLDVPHRGLWKV